MFNQSQRRDITPYHATSYLWPRGRTHTHTHTRILHKQKQEAMQAHAWLKNTCTQKQTYNEIYNLISIGTALSTPKMCSNIEVELQDFEIFLNYERKLTGLTASLPDHKNRPTTSTTMCMASILTWYIGFSV